MSTSSTPLTKEEFQLILNEALGNLRNETKEDNLSLREEMKENNLSLREEMKEEFKKQDLKMEIRLAEQKQEIIDQTRQYRDDVLTRMDADAKKSEEEREEGLFINHELRDHEKRITKLEQS